METGDSLKTTRVIRSPRTGVFLPRQGTFVRDVENLGRKMILSISVQQEKSICSRTKYRKRRPANWYDEESRKAKP